MATYEGAEHLQEQVESIAGQTYGDWRLWVSDDSHGSDTRELLLALMGRLGGRASYRLGPRKGCLANFLALACAPDIAARFYAFSDQDDVWFPDKLERAVHWLEGISPSVPALYCSRTGLVDEDGRELGMSPLFSRRPAFGNALVQSLAGGNTMVFNEAARDLLVAAGADVDVPVHDWWLYLLVTGCGGVVHYDGSPSLAYRQHDRNVIGCGQGWRARVERLNRVFVGGVHRRWSDMNLAALDRVRGRLTAESLGRLERFASSRVRGPVGRLLGVYRAGLYRQTWQGNVALFFAALLGRI